MYLSLLFRQEAYERNFKYWPTMWDVAAGLEINQLKLHNYVASGTCPKHTNPLDVKVGDWKK